MDNLLKEIATKVKEAEKILFITGAGMSADSGLPTYRGIGGLYDDNNTEDNIPIETAISGDMLRRKPEITWKYLLQISRSCKGASFNDGHRVLAEIEKSKPQTWILTQNIDGFHRAAGSNNVIEIHGSLEKISCMNCSYKGAADDLDVDMDNLPPYCNCGGVIRHDVVLFGEQLPEAEINKLYDVLQNGYDMVFSIGTTSVFPYIAQPVMLAKQKGITSVEINPGETEVSSLADYRIKTGASEALRKIWGYAQI
ncbi:MAG: NAD-dependent deacylase [Gammaproteobacteria bacterium]|nr:MAG: NAD-dependent deacylase [Gammaproteobacteria bacterium]